MLESVEKRCAEIFRDVAGLSKNEADTARLITAPFESLEVDSLTLLDFVMKVEADFDVELDEAAVNACRTVRELALLVTAMRGGPKASADCGSAIARD